MRPTWIHVEQQLLLLLMWYPVHIVNGHNIRVVVVTARRRESLHKFIYLIRLNVIFMFVIFNNSRTINILAYRVSPSCIPLLSLSLQCSCCFFWLLLSLLRRDRWTSAAHYGHVAILGGGVCGCEGRPSQLGILSTHTTTSVRCRSPKAESREPEHMHLIRAREPDEEPKQLIINNCRRRSSRRSRSRSRSRSWKRAMQLQAGLAARVTIGIPAAVGSQRPWRTVN